MSRLEHDVASMTLEELRAAYLDLVERCEVAEAFVERANARNASIERVNQAIVNRGETK